MQNSLLPAPQNPGTSLPPAGAVLTNWKVALGIEVEDRPFAKSTLQVFRAQMILHDRVREVFESSLRIAQQSGNLKRRSIRVALDTTPGPGRGEGHLQSAGRRDGQAAAGPGAG